ncbi:hypothetical protein TNCV_2057351 [Trichonephila clavipes]|nr:hypothetical protein TNCV_2057351 [Trichonephila clavipes]
MAKERRKPGEKNPIKGRGGQRSQLKTKRKLDDAGASELNRLYPESREKDEKERSISEFTPPTGGGWRKRAAERGRNWSDVTRARREERRKGGLNSPKTPGMKRKESASKIYRRHSRWNEAGTSFNTDPSSDERQMLLNIVSVASKRHLLRTLRYLRDRPIERQPIAIRVKEIWTSKRYHS